MEKERREREKRKSEEEEGGERERARVSGAFTYSLSDRQVHMPNWRVPASMHWRIMRR